MLEFMFVYRGGIVPDDQVEQNVSDLWKWLNNLKEKGYEKFRFAGNGLKIVSQYSVNDYSGDVFGVSIIEAESLEEAISLTTDWPELQYGGRIEIVRALGD
ncbi:YciI family protein [Halalkalibacter urbisdiaboli]|uniref:YciI family protein n=1 Tax=Halalkalibacter urbisdiaboli TaxID=1960589 RepID=UPI000B45230E|nr:YciI family protein [Halalkalibacter urbisdiaboli]